MTAAVPRRLRPPRDDAELVRRFRAGDDAAFDQIVRRHSRS
jgi:hypothetical protein